MSSLSSMSLLIFAIIGLVLIALSLRALLGARGVRGGSTHGQAHRGTPGKINRSTSGENPSKDLERLFSDIRRALRVLASPARAGGMYYREKQEEVGRLLFDMQARLRLLDDGIRERYEAKAGHVLAEAARAGITLPPLETPMISGFYSP